ncbi:MAG: hypothetical protein B7C55_05300 [Actinomycetales bacterium mxb001]|nr:MAG: hypothetical protein B7C55_05300 [Actinomycetales bacterium mxb001]
MELSLNLSIPSDIKSVDSLVLSKLQNFCENYIFLYNLHQNGNLHTKSYSCFLEGYVDMAYNSYYHHLINKEQFSNLLEIPVPRAKYLIDKYSKEYSSKPKTLKRELDSLTNNLFFNSESSYPFTVDVISPCTLLNLDFSLYQRLDFYSFFQPLIKEELWFDSSELSIARRYSSLFHYLDSNLRNLYVFSRDLNDTEKYRELIVAGEGNNLVVLLKTKAIFS